ncbi:MAG: phosphoribosyltransferase family protein [Oscillospiraceae bacterium]
MNFTDFLYYVFFTKQCPICKTPCLPQENFCEKCQSQIIFIHQINTCKICGLNNCISHKIIPMYEELITVFQYDEVSKQSILSFKFNNRKNLYKTFSKLMCDVIHQQYSHIEFDFITEVPMHKKKIVQRGYNQSALLAKSISGVFDLFHSSDLLEKTSLGIAQHTLDLSQRLANPIGLFQVNPLSTVYNQTILLIDDVFTTGSTINECAKQLKLAGAKAVYCCVIATVSHK